jgi:hypothetical protein
MQQHSVLGGRLAWLATDHPGLIPVDSFLTKSERIPHKVKAQLSQSESAAGELAWLATDHPRLIQLSQSESAAQSVLRSDEQPSEHQRTATHYPTNVLVRINLDSRKVLSDPLKL